MHIQINEKVIKSLKPCADRYENYLEHYSDFNGSVEEFLDLDKISHGDKLWVTLRLIPRFLVEVFAIDCALSAAAYGAAYAAAYAADAAAYAADAAAAAAYAAYAADAYAAYAAYAADAAAADAAADAYDAAYAKEQQRQIETLIYLIQTHKARQLCL